MPAPADSRPPLTAALESLLAAMTQQVPELRGIDAKTLLVVSLGAHGGSVASVRPLLGSARSVRIGGHKRLIELGLRPGFFLAGDAVRRTATLVHELLHLDPAAPGSLHPERRHARLSHQALEREARTLARRFLSSCDPRHVLCLAHDGEVLLRAWRHRPIDTTSGRLFTDADVYDTPVRMLTPPPARGGWW